MRCCLLLPLALAACPDGTDSDTELPPAPLTARFVADASMRDCEWGGEQWVGVTQLGLTLEHKVSGPPERALPAPGTCENGLALYAEQAFSGGDDIPDLTGPPRWTGLPGSGALDQVLPGLWHRAVFRAEERCGTLLDTIGDGVTLEVAGGISGLVTPATGTIDEVLADGVRLSSHDPVDIGDPVELTWQVEGFDASFVQIRRLLDGDPRQTITCTPDEQGSYTLGDDAWSLVDDGILADQLVLAVGFSTTRVVDLGDVRAEVQTRATHTLAP